MKHRSLVCALTLASLACAAGVNATTVRQLSDEALVERSAAIVIGHCAAAESQWVEGSLVTVATISVAETLKGRAQSKIRVVLPGGIDADRAVPVAMDVPGAPRISPGDEVFLFLARGALLPGTFTIAGFSQGKFAIVEDPREGRVVIRDLTGVHLLNATALAPGGTRGTSLAQFRRQINQMVKKAASTTSREK